MNLLSQLVVGLHVEMKEKGKLAPASDIVEKVLSELYDKKDLIGKKVLVTAGPTRANIDPVRFISNRSTGKMGYAIAEEARDREGQNEFFSGPTNKYAPYGINVIKINTNEEMRSRGFKAF